LICVFLGQSQDIAFHIDTVLSVSNSVRADIFFDPNPEPLTLYDLIHVIPREQCPIAVLSFFKISI